KRWTVSNVAMKTRVRLFRAVCWLAWAALVGCKSVDTQPTPSPAGSPSTQAPANPPALTKVKYNAALDKEFEEIFELAKKNYWEEAEFRASRLYEQYPNDSAVARIYDWVSKQREVLRARAVEDKIREIDSKHSVFNPSLGDLLTEQKDRGLPPRKDVRDVVQDIEAQPYIPKNYGKVVRRQGPLFDLESPRGRMSQVLTNKVTLHLDNVTLEQLILHVSQAAGINFIADKSIAGLKQVLSVHMDSVTLDDLLRYLARNAQIQFQVGDEMVWVVDGKDPKNLLEETRFYRLRYGFVTPAQFGASEITRTTTVTPQKVKTTVETEKVNRFVNDGAPPVPSIEQAIKQFFKGSNYY
ncbi:type II secretion system protein GspD, partial [Candidatus Parcubacteria bacterium]